MWSWHMAQANLKSTCTHPPMQKLSVSLATDILMESVISSLARDHAVQKAGVLVVMVGLSNGIFKKGNVSGKSTVRQCLELLHYKLFASRRF